MINRPFKVILNFLKENPTFIPKEKWASLDDAAIKEIEAHYENGKDIGVPSSPKTETDPVIFEILRSYFGYDSKRESEEQYEKLHKACMASENFIGKILEQYLDSVLKNYGWVWCAGETVKAIDFLKLEKDGTWRKLQIKNKSNTENSSSSKVREGTDIEKWFRMYSTKRKKNPSQFNWGNFPDEDAKKELSEENFREYVRNYFLI